MSSAPITVKWQHHGRYRRFALDNNEHAYNLFRQAIAQIAPDAANAEVGWRDADGDEILIGSQLELLDAINNRQGDVLRVHTLGEEPLSVASTPVVEKAPELPPKAQPPTKSEPAKKEDKIHFSVICDGCSMNPVVGPRFKCLACPDYDLCKMCAEKNVHQLPGHTFMRIDDSQDDTWKTHFFRCRRGPRGPWHHPRHPMFRPAGPPGAFGPYNWQPRRPGAPPCPPGNCPPPPRPPQPEQQQQQADPTEAYNEAFKAIFDNVSKYMNENKEAINKTLNQDFLRDIGKAAADALSHLGIDADIDIESDGKRERMNAEKKAADEAALLEKKEAEEKKEDEAQKEADKQPSAPAAQDEPAKQNEETPVVAPKTPEVEILDGGNWQFVSHTETSPTANLYPSVVEGTGASTSGVVESAESKCLAQLLAMGFANDGGWLEAIVKAKKGDLNQVLNALQRKD